MENCSRVLEKPEALLKIAVLNQHLLDGLGGSEVQCDLIARHLTRLGHDVVYVALGGRQADYGTAYRTLSLHPVGVLGVFRILRKERPDIVYWRHNKKGLLVTAALSKILGVRFVFSMSHISDSQVWRYTGLSGFRLPVNLDLRSLARSASSWLDPLRSALNFAAIPLLADGVISNNADFLGGMPVRRKAVIHNSLDSSADPFQWPRPYVVWIANIKTRKNPESYYELSRVLVDLGIDFLMIGRIQGDRYNQVVAEWEKSENFYYLGPKTLAETNGIIQGSLFLAHTCEPEGFPNNFIQAWMQGKPVVSLQFDPEGILERERLGSHSREFGRFVKDVKVLIQDENLRLETGARARDFAQREFDPQVNTGKLESFLGSVVGQVNPVEASE